MVNFLIKGIYNRGDIKLCMELNEEALLDFNKAIELRP